MKKFLYVILLAAFGIQTNTNAQVDTSWVRRFDGPLNSADAGRFVKVDKNGFVYVGVSIAKSPGNPDAAIIKYNPEGDTLWLRYYNNPFNLGSYIYDMDFDINGDIIITGSSVSPNYDDWFTAKFDSGGNLLWSRRFDDGNVDQALTLATDGLGNLFIAGLSWAVYQGYNFKVIKYSPVGDTIWTYNWLGFEDAEDIARDIVIDKYGNVLIAGTCGWGTSDYVVIQVNSSGNTNWIRKYDSPENGHDYLKAIVTDDIGNIYVTGDSYKPGRNDDIITIKYDAFGDTLWTRRYAGSGNGDDRVYAMIIDSNGNVYLAASTFVAGNGIDCLTIKYSSSGELLWAKTYSEYSFYNDVVTSITMDKFRNIYVSGFSSTSSSNLVYLTIKYDNDGNQKWTAKYNGPGYNGYDATSSVFADDHGFVYVTGSSAGVSSHYDIATIKYFQTPSNVSENPSEWPTKYELFQNYPNPFNPSTRIRYQVPSISQVTLKVYDILGNEVTTLVNEEKPAGNYEVEFNPSSGIRNLASGIYFYQLKTGEYKAVKKMLLIK